MISTFITGMNYLRKYFIVYFYTFYFQNKKLSEKVRKNNKLMYISTLDKLHSQIVFYGYMSLIMTSSWLFYAICGDFSLIDKGFDQSKNWECRFQFCHFLQCYEFQSISKKTKNSYLVNVNIVLLGQLNHRIDLSKIPANSVYYLPISKSYNCFILIIFLK